VPLQWALAQNNLGNALENLGERESGTARLEEAVAAFRLALQERTRERVPLDWAMTQNNLGWALTTLGERESGTTHMEEAVTAYRLALQERTRERVPLDWAVTQENVAVALQKLGQRTSSHKMLEEAVQDLKQVGAVRSAAGQTGEVEWDNGRIAQIREIEKNLMSSDIADAPKDLSADAH
jgi:tetratricopeptide (TPR) repeat protein